MPVLTDQEKASCRHHLGYVQVTQVSTYFLGIPAALQTMFMLEQAMNLLMPGADENVRRQLRILDRIEELDVEGLEDVEAEEVDGIRIDPKFFPKRWRQYLRWQGSLANIFGVIPDPYDLRLGAMGGGSLSVPRRHG